MQHKVSFFFACLNFESTSLEDLWSKVAAMYSKGVVLSKIFVQRTLVVGTVFVTKDFAVKSNLLL